MAIKREEEFRRSIKVKGILEAVSEDGLEILDEKEDEIEKLKFSEFDKFLGKSINFSIVESTKNEVVVEEE